LALFGTKGSYAYNQSDTRQPAQREEKYRPQNSGRKGPRPLQCPSPSLRAESAVLPGEDQAKFDQHLARLSAAWINQDDMERDLVETIAVNQGKLARIDRSESRLERSISCTIADLERYRKGRIERHADAEPKDGEKYQGGLLWQTDAGRSYSVLPKVLVLDGVWREIPREILGDFTPQPPS
jgi:hypothetical protein